VEEGVMKKLLFLLVCALLLCAIVVPASQASQSPAMPPVLSEASGVWSWTYTDVGFGWDAALLGWTYAFNNQERGVWTGTFTGTSVEPWVYFADPDGNLWAMITIHFKGTVAGRHGKADIALAVDVPAGSEEPMGGQWSVVHSQGGLDRLHGLGTWVWTRDDEAAGLSFADYSGAIWWQ
jgi:hypothetical protein